MNRGFIEQFCILLLSQLSDLVGIIESLGEDPVWDIARVQHVGKGENRIEHNGSCEEVRVLGSNSSTQKATIANPITVDSLGINYPLTY